MKFVSYAQNFEDVILNRAFKGKDDGFYIDVGASHPTGHSVTKNFYDRGWRGINIEPGSKMFALIEVERGRDINLNVGISRTAGFATFYEAPDSLGISTFNDEFREDWMSRGEQNFVEKRVRTMTLVEVCEQYVDRPIDFLKVDVEGLEAEVLAGADFARWRPRIVVVEGNKKLYQEPLLASKYIHATFDGVNHYFVAKEEARLIKVLKAPVSLVIDNFELHEHLIDRDGHRNAYRLLVEARTTRDGLEVELAVSRNEMAKIRESSTQALLEMTSRRDELEERRHELARLQESTILALVEATRRGDELEEQLADQCRQMEQFQESATHALWEETTRGDQLEDQLDELQDAIAILRDSSNLTISELMARRDELEWSLQVSRREIEEITARHEALRSRIGPLIKVYRGLKKARTILSHPAHHLNRRSVIGQWNGAEPSVGPRSTV